MEMLPHTLEEWAFFLVVVAVAAFVIGFFYAAGKDLGGWIRGRWRK